MCARTGRGELVIGEIVENARIGLVLFEDLENAAVLVLGGGEYPRGFALEKNRRVSAASVGEATDDDHDARRIGANILFGKRGAG